jgi:UDP-N-acetyl-2-amino-2-deoxyglucuronate dehydrogenase
MALYTKMAKNFALIGCAGYIAPRHLEAIKKTGNNLVAALDKSDSVGRLDRYFEDVQFFTEFEIFDRYIEKTRREGKKIDYVSICSPNYLHDAHIRFALRSGANAICEKPLVINPWSLDALEQFEKESGKRVYNILQLRLHPALIDLKNKISKEQSSEKHKISLDYITFRGPWYQYSWKGDEGKSGGLVTNLGIHFFDMLGWIFGKVESYKIISADPRKVRGISELEKATVDWFLSIDKQDLPEDIRAQGKTAYRALMLDGKEIEFSEGFTDLHTRSYEEILAGRGFGIKDVRASVELAYNLRKEISKIK